MSRISGVQTKYLHVIYKLEIDNNGVRGVDIARAMGVSKASVHKTLNLLVELGLVSKELHGLARLTPEGKSTGSKIQEKITVVYPFFTDFLNLDPTEALESTYSFLCYFPDNCVKTLFEKKQKLGMTSYG